MFESSENWQKYRLSVDQIASIFDRSIFNDFAWSAMSEEQREFEVQSAWDNLDETVRNFVYDLFSPDRDEYMVALGLVVTRCRI